MRLYCRVRIGGRGKPIHNRRDSAFTGRFAADWRAGVTHTKCRMARARCCDEQGVENEGVLSTGSDRFVDEFACRRLLPQLEHDVLHVQRS